MTETVGNEKWKLLISVSLTAFAVMIVWAMAYVDIGFVDRQIASRTHNDALHISGIRSVHSASMYILAGCFSLILAGTGAAVYCISRKKAHSETFASLYSINEELQQVMDERTDTACRLEQHDRLFRSVVNSVRQAIAWKDTDLKYVGCNQSFAALMGCDSPERITGRTDEQIYADADFSRTCCQHDREVIRTGIPLLNAEGSIASADGGETRIMISRIPLYDRNGTVSGLICLLEKDEVPVTANTNFSECVSPQQSNLVTRLGNGIRTPMNSILGFAELLGQENLTEEQSGFVRMISDSARNMLDVVDDIAGSSGESHQIQHDNTPAQYTAAAPQEASGPADNALRADSGKTEDRQSAGDYRVLIADDVAENRMLIEVLLKKAGYTTVSCRDGKEAVNLADKERFDLILMDIQMPEMNGLDATRTIKSRGPNCHTPILAMTASVATEDEMLCLDAGCDDYVRKPIKKESLLKKIWRYSEQKKQLNAASRGDEVTSFLSGDPDYQKAIETFVENLPARIEEIRQAFDTENLQDLSFKIHTLKGLGGFAGFPVYSELAKSIEVAVSESRLDEVRRKIDEMVDLCRRTKLTSC